MMDFIDLAKVCAPEVHISTLVALVKHESGFNPLIINVNGKPGRQIRPKTREQAIAHVRELQAMGASFDAGYGQINNANWPRLGITPETVFDPCTNLRAAQAVLVECYQGANKKLDGQQALFAALSCYNTGNYTYGLKNGYVRKVVAGAGNKTAIPTVPALTPSADAEPARPSQMANSTEPTAPSKDAFTQPRGDAFAQARPDAFAQAWPIRTPVGSIVYHGGTRP